MLLEAGVPLSRSAIWKIQRDYFAECGIEAWNRGEMPHYITNNPFMAKAYAEVVSGWLRDCATLAGEGSDPVYIVELGSGLGRFAYHFLRRLGTMLSRPRLRSVPFRYAMTDFTAKTIEFWRAHPKLRPLVDDGILDFARFDAAEPGEIYMIEAGYQLELSARPMVLLANYVFDSVPQDLFSVRDGQLLESKMDVASSKPGDTLASPCVLSRLQISLEHLPAPTDYYSDPEFNRILEHYRNNLTNTTFCFP